MLVTGRREKPQMKFETCISTHKGDGLASVTFTSENREQAEEAAEAMNIWSFHRIPEDDREVTESRWKSIGFGWTEGGGSGGPDIDPERFQQLPPDDG